MAIETALVIVPPKNVQAFAYPLREEYASLSFHQMPAHITLLYPFVSEGEIDPALHILNQVCSHIAPFELTLDCYDRFENVHYLTTSEPDIVIRIQGTLAKAFPDYPLYSGVHGSVFVPHLTLADFETRAESEGFELPPAPLFKFQVSNLHLYLGETDAQAPFIPRAVIPLGSTS
jgi:2'-5' RNA ligase